MGPPTLLHKSSLSVSLQPPQRISDRSAFWGKEDLGACIKVGLRAPDRLNFWIGAFQLAVFCPRIFVKLNFFLQVVAVKQLDRNGLQGNREFLVEVLMLSLLHHPNLVNLIGYCADGDQRLLVYEFMPLGSLEDHLHGKG